MGRLILLLDTHVLLWWLFDDSRLGDVFAATISDTGNRICVSAASAWEISSKFRLGKLPDAKPLVEDFEGLMARARFSILPVSARHAVLAGSWQVPHRDPFDRMLAAQSHIEGMPLMSVDQAFTQFDMEIFAS